MNNRLKAFGILMAAILGLLLGAFLLLDYLFFSTERLPKGVFIAEANSPTEAYTVRVYVAKSGATVQDAVRGEVIFHEKNDKQKNIYWQYRESDAKIVWLDAHRVLINDVELDVRKDVYDYRKEAE